MTTEPTPLQVAVQVGMAAEREVVRLRRLVGEYADRIAGGESRGSVITAMRHEADWGMFGHDVSVLDDPRVVCVRRDDLMAVMRDGGIMRYDRGLPGDPDEAESEAIYARLQAALLRGDE